MIAREAGLEPLADRLFADPWLDPLAEAAGVHRRPTRAARLPWPRPGLPTPPPCSTACATCSSERWAEDAALVGKLREWLWAEARLQSKLVDGKDGQHPDAAKFRDYFDYAEPIRTVPVAPRAGGVPRPHAGVAGRQAGARRGSRARQARRWPRAASPATWAGATPSAPATN